MSSTESVISSLHSFSLANGLVGNPFTNQRIQYELVINAAGEFVDLVPVDKRIQLPMIVLRASNVSANLGYDVATYVVGINNETPHKVTQRFPAFYLRLIEFLRASGDNVALQAVESFYSTVSTWKPMLLKRFGELAKLNIKLKFDGKEWMTLLLEGDSVPLILRDAPKKLWVHQFNQSISDTGNDICCVTGVACEAVRLHEKVSGVPGTGGKVPLISFDTPDNPISYNGRVQGANFPMSRFVATSYVAAIHHLLEEVDGRRHRSALDLTQETILLAWSDNMDVSPLLDVLDPFVPCEPEDYPSLWQRVESLSTSDSIMHMLVLRGAQGRISILDWDKTTVGEVARNLIQFRDKYWDENPGLIGRAFRILESDHHNLDHQYKRALVRSIMLGSPYPSMLRSFLVERINNTFVEKQYGSEKAILAARCRWISIIDNQPIQRKPVMEDIPAAPQYQIPAGKSASYYFGAFIQTFMRLQRQYHNYKIDDNSGKFSKSALQAPMQTLVELLHKAQSYESRLKSKDQQYINRLKNLHMEIVGLGGIPKFMAPEQQQDFMAGMVVQRAFDASFDIWFRAKRALEKDQKLKKDLERAKRAKELAQSP